MPTGEGFSNDQVREISKAITTANGETGLLFSVYIGDVDGDIRDAAEKLHAALAPRSAHAVLIVVSPGDRLLEIVTGKDSSRRVSDRACSLAALSMQTSFSGGDLSGGILTGVRMLAEAAGHPLAVATR